MKRIKTLLSLIAISALAQACATSNVKLHESVNGGYLAPKANPYYTTVNGVLYANDGERWYALRSHEVDAGEIKGAHVVLPERWIVAGGSRVVTYHRTPSTFRDQDKQPVMVQQ